MNQEQTNDNAQQQPALPNMIKNENEAVHFFDYWQILYSRKEIVIAVAMLLILSGIVITRRMPRVYAAQAIIEVQRETPNINLYGATSIRYDPIFLKTQFEIIKSDPVIEQVVLESRLDEELGIAYGWKATHTKQSVLERTISLVKNKTTLSIYRDTNLISILVKLDKPDHPDGEAAKVAARVANTIAKVFLDYTRNKSKVAVERALEALGDEVKDLDRQIADVEDQIAQVREKEGIVILTGDDAGTAAVRTLVARLTEEANRAKITATVKKSRYERIVELSPTEAAASLSILIGDTSLAPLISARQQHEMSITALEKSGLGTNHPEMVKTRALLSEINSKIEERVRDIKNGLKIDWEQAQSEADMYEARKNQLAESERKISAGVSIKLERLQKDLAALKARRAAIESRMDDERINLAIPKTSVEIVEHAKVPEVPLPVSPNFALNVSLSVAAGIFFGVVIAFFIEYLDTTIKTADDVEKFLQCNVLAVIPQRIRNLNDPLARSKHSEVYRIMRMNIKSQKNLGVGKLLVFTSASAGEGKSTTSFNTAWVFAESGEKVLLIDVDLHHPRQHKILNTSQTPGLANVIVGEAPLDSAIVKTSQANLDFLPAGRIMGTSVLGLMDTDEMHNLLKTVSERYDRIILDGTPVIGISDTAQLCRICDGVVLIIQHRKYPRALCRRARNNILSMGGNLLGVVLNNVNAAHDASSYYYEHQYYYYYYSTDDKGNQSRVRRASSHHHRGDEESKKS